MRWRTLGTLGKLHSGSEMWVGIWKIFNYCSFQAVTLNSLFPSPSKAPLTGIVKKQKQKTKKQNKTKQRQLLEESNNTLFFNVSILSTSFTNYFPCWKSEYLNTYSLKKVGTFILL